MIAPQSLLRAFDPATYDAIQAFKVTDPALMPWDYQAANPAGRPLHDDWAVFSDTPRIETAYRVPLPFKLIKGDNVPQWMLWDPTYPQSPGLIIETRPIFDGVKVQNQPQALVDCAVEDSGYATFAVWLGGKWVPCFQSYRKVIFGRLYAQYTGGLKQDLTVTFDQNLKPKSDLMGWIDPPSVSWNKES